VRQPSDHYAHRPPKLFKEPTETQSTYFSVQHTHIHTHRKLIYHKESKTASISLQTLLRTSINQEEKDKQLKRKMEKGSTFKVEDKNGQ
jgi:hypothetical protein